MIAVCNGHGECLPIINVNCTSSVVEVSWLALPLGDYGHKINFRYFVNGEMHTTSFPKKNGKMSIKLESFYSSYSFYYEAYCNESGCNGCKECGSVPLRYGSIGGEPVDYPDCLKEYYLYTARLNDSSTLELWRKDYSVPDPYDYIELNAGRVHIGAGYSGVGERCEELTVTRNDTNRVVTVHRLPYESGKTCRIELYNKDACPETDKHYVYIVYYCNPMTGQIEIQQGPTERNGHNGLS